MLRETIEFTTLHGTVRDFDKAEHSVTVLTCDSIGQVKRKILEAVHRYVIVAKVILYFFSSSEKEQM